MTRGRWAALAGAGVVAAGGLGIVGVMLLARSDRLVAAASRAIGRPLTVERRTLSLRGGLGLALGDLRIADDPAFNATEPFLTTQSLEMRVALAELLRGRLVIDRVVLEEPVVRIVRDAAGRLNVDSLGRGPERAEGDSADAGTRHGRRPFALRVLRLRHGTVRYTAPPGRTAVLSELAVEVRDPRRGAPIPVGARGRLAAHGVRLDDLVADGTLTLAEEGASYRGTLRGGTGNVGPIVLSRMDADVAWAPPRGTVGFSAGEGRLLALRLGGVVLDVLRPFMKPGDTDRLRRRYPDLFNDEGVAFTRLAGSARLEGERLRSDDLEVTGPSYVVHGAGTVVLGGDVDLAVTLSATPALANDLLGRSPARAALVDEGGALRVPLRVQGPAAHPRVRPAPELVAAVTRQVLGGTAYENAGSLLERLLRPRRRRER